MTEIIKITEQDGKKAVNARDLHEFLENKKQFSDWIKHRIKKYGLVENHDYQAFSLIGENGGKSIEYALSLDCAKELAMVEGNDRGKDARQYFIKCEKAFKEVVKQISYAESLRLLADKIEQNEKLLLENEEKKQQLDESRDWYSIKRYAIENGINWRKISWRKLKVLSYELGYNIKKIFDANYGQVNIYHKNVFCAYYS